MSNWQNSIQNSCLLPNLFCVETLDGFYCSLHLSQIGKNNMEVVTFVQLHNITTPFLFSLLLCVVYIIWFEAPMTHKTSAPRYRVIWNLICSLGQIFTPKCLIMIPRANTQRTYDFDGTKNKCCLHCSFVSLIHRSVCVQTCYVHMFDNGIIHSFYHLTFRWTLERSNVHHCA